MGVRHNCGWCVAPTLHDTYRIIKDLEHRGREAGGMFAVSHLRNRIDAVKWVGPIGDVFDLDGLNDFFESLIPVREYDYFGAHNRYATRGRKDLVLYDAHPHIIAGPDTIVEDHGIFMTMENVDGAIVHNGQVDEVFLSGIDESLLTTDCDSERLLRYLVNHGPEQLIRNVPGTYTLAAVSKENCKVGDIVIARDRFGVRPGYHAMKDGAVIAGSEDWALKKNGANRIFGNLHPGTIYSVSSNGKFSKGKVLPDEERKGCVFEMLYIANEESTLDEVTVGRVRAQMGRQMAKEIKLPGVQFVTYVPRCPRAAAVALAHEWGVESVQAFMKTQKRRSFMGPDEVERSDSIKSNLHLLRKNAELLRGKIVALIDDSIVRGNNIKYAIKLLNEVGVQKIHVLSYSPRIGIYDEFGRPSGCVDGTDMPPLDNFVSVNRKERRNRTLEEISREIGAEVHYLSLEGMFKALENSGVRDPRDNMCYRCMGGPSIFGGVERKIQLTVSANGNI